jgi:hypothetical protein
VIPCFRVDCLSGCGGNAKPGTPFAIFAVRSPSGRYSTEALPLSKKERLNVRLF